MGEKVEIEISKIYLHISLVLNISSKPIIALCEDWVVLENIYSKVAVAMARWIFQVCLISVLHIYFKIMFT